MFDVDSVTREYLAQGADPSDAARLAAEAVQPGGAMRQARTRAGLSMSQAAERAGLGFWRWDVLERGQADPSFSEGTMICRTIGIEPGGLIAVEV